jgi:hypothetical protein
MRRIQQTQIGIYTKDAKEKIENLTNTQVSYLQDNSENLNSKFGGDTDLIENMMTSGGNLKNPFKDHILYTKDPNGFALNMNKFVEYAVPISKEAIINNPDLFKSMVANPNPNGGLIYADHNLKIDCKIKSFLSNNEPGLLGVMFVFIPISNEKIEEIEIELSNYQTNELINIQFSKVKYPDGSSNVPYSQILMKAQILDSFSSPPTVSINCRIGMLRTELNFALPLVVSKYLEPYDTSVENFTAMWYEYTNSPDEVFQKMDSILYNPMNHNYSHMDFLKKLGGLMTNLNFKVYPPHDKENFHELEGVAVLHYLDKSHSIPLLFQASFVPSHNSEFRFSLRSKNPDVQKFSSLLLDIFSIVKFYINPN